ncbi:MAG: polysaccharide biosynthesis tyrosine autokinase, partial [Desulfobulbaceae bacterium]|nr:polysaccharide biosynthesis tyrosine autokinase [Desulfobulbaceae bacterium]
AVQGEGKTNTAANLAYTLALTGKTVLMVDADLRKPGLTRRMSAKGENGLSFLVSTILGKQLNKGEIADYGLKDLIKLCSLQQQTGVMNINDKANELELFFLSGKLVDIYWKNRPESKKLANTLIIEKILTKEEALLALGHQKKSVRRLGSILLNMGLVTEKELNKIISLHMMEAFRISTDMVGGTFTFKSLGEQDVLKVVNKLSDLDDLYSEFLEDNPTSSFIMKAIDSATLETGHENLFLLPSGNIPPNPSELIGSAYTRYLFSLLQHKFDVVIIDTSPVVPASDALMLAPEVDGVVLVVKAGAAERKILQDTVQQLTNAKANILGVTLNQVDRTQNSYYKYYKGYYGE